MQQLNNQEEEMNGYTLAYEIKVVVVSFQCAPTGMSHYFTICAQPQGINENSKYGENIVEVLTEAAINV